MPVDGSCIVLGDGRLTAREVQSLKFNNFPVVVLRLSRVIKITLRQAGRSWGITVRGSGFGLSLCGANALIFFTPLIFLNWIRFQTRRARKMPGGGRMIRVLGDLKLRWRRLISINLASCL